MKNSQGLWSNQMCCKAKWACRVLLSKNISSLSVYCSHKGTVLSFSSRELYISFILHYTSLTLHSKITTIATIRPVARKQGYPIFSWQFVLWMTPSGTGLVAQGYPISKVSRMKLLLWRPWNNIAAKRDTFITYKSRKRRAHLTPDLKRDLKTVPERGNYSDSEKKTNINKARGSQGRTLPCTLLADAARPWTGKSGPAFECWVGDAPSRLQDLATLNEKKKAYFKQTRA